MNRSDPEYDFAKDMTLCRTLQRCITKLTQSKFKLVAPHTLHYVTARDVISVYLTNDIVIVTADGPHVINTYEVRQVRNLGPDSYPFWEDTLQMILGKI